MIPSPALVRHWLPIASTYTTLGRTDCNHVDAATAAWRYQPSHRCGPTKESNATEVSYQYFLLRKCLLGRGLFEIGPSRCRPPAQLGHQEQAWAGDCWLTGDRWLLSLPYFTAELAQRGTSAAAISGPGSSLGSDPHRSIANCPVSRELTTPTLFGLGGSFPLVALAWPFTCPPTRSIHQPWTEGPLASKLKLSARECRLLLVFHLQKDLVAEELFVTCKF